jgi:hypothetical protein
VAGSVTLTVLYNLPEGADHDAFLRWRLGAHQTANAAAPGVLYTTFAVAQDTPLGAPPFRYMTQAVFASRADLDAAFFTPEAQVDFARDTAGLRDTVVLVSDTLVSDTGRGGSPRPAPQHDPQPDPQPEG